MPTIPAEPANQGFTLQEMIDEATDQLRDTRVSSKITRWLNLEIYSLSGRFNWPHLYAEGTLAIIAAQRDYDLTNLMRSLIVLNIPSIPRTLYPIDEKYLSEMVPDYQIVQGEPIGYILKDRALSLFRVPDTNYTAYYHYYKYPTKLVNPSDISDYPVQWHPVLIQSAIVRGFRYENNTEQIQEAQAEYNRLYALAAKTVYSAPNQRHVFSSSEGRYASKRVTLPTDHYPRVI